MAAAAGNIGLNFALVPRFGMMGAAWANAIAYAIQALLAYRFSQRFYPVEYEAKRIATLTAAALSACLVARALPAMPPIAGVLVRGATVVALYAAVLALTGFFRADELRALASLRQRVRPRPEPQVPEVTELAGEIVAAELPLEEMQATESKSRR